MKIKEALDNYYFYSGKTSDGVRQLALGGIAIVWIFKVEKGDFLVPLKLIVAAEVLVGALALDFFQYAVGSLVWGAYHRYKEKRVSPDFDFLAPRMINWIPLFLFWAKVVAVLAAYGLLLVYLASRIRGL